ncbi:MAG: sulfotransferase [Acidimicrobiales bacterium]
MSKGGPVFIVCSARSGSTLLNRLLGMHDRIAAPAECNLSAACHFVMQAAATLANELVEDEASKNREHKQALAQVRRMAKGVMRPYLRARGADIFADKSLTNVDHAELLVECFPEARFVCLHRHCLDVVYSLIEASPWGFDAFGAMPFVARNPNNFVAGLVDKWICTTRAEIEFAAAHGEVSTTVRYEDLVGDPVGLMGRLFGELGLEVPGALDGTSQVSFEREANCGPADYKIAFTNEVETSSIGRGRRLPLAAIPPPLLEVANELLEKLGYAKLDEAWNRSVGEAAHAVLSEGRRVTLDVIVAQLEKRLAGGTANAEWQAAVALEDLGTTVVIDFATRTVKVAEGFGDPFCIAVSSALLGVLLGHVNAGTILRRGELRVCDPQSVTQGANQEGNLDTLLELIVPTGSAPLVP